MSDSLFFALYLSAYAAINNVIMEEVFAWADSGYIDGVIIDVKDERYVRFEPYNSEYYKYQNIKPVFGKLNTFVKRIKKHKLKPIVRFICFRDLTLPFVKREWAILDRETGLPWRDIHGKYWLNPYNRELWNYIIGLLKEIKNAGVNEIHLDYIRFPSDGELEKMDFQGLDSIPKKEIIGEFLKTVNDSLKGVKITGCAFGFLAFWGELKRESQSILFMREGLDEFAFMLYPSHFGKGFLYIPREIDFWGREYLIYSLAPLRAREYIDGEAGIGVYVQAFNYKAPGFGKDYIKSQIKGAYSSGIKRFYLWHSSAEYREGIKAIKEFKKELQEKVEKNKRNFSISF